MREARGVLNLAALRARRTDIDGLWVLEMKQASDDRGTVREFFRESAYSATDLPNHGPWVQVNITESNHGAIRGLHGEQMSKLVAIADGEAFGAYVDARPESPTRGNTVTVLLAKGTQVLVPAGVCNGFQSVSPGVTQYLYCFDREWSPEMAGVAVNPFDPTLAIAWPIPVDPDNPRYVSVKDRALPSLTEALAPASPKAPNITA
jgi:dTDP-4-dehydrorhamnose 3,5-epimerase